MGLFFAIFFGGLVGAVGGSLLRENYDVAIIDGLVGIVGSILALFIYFLATTSDVLLLFSWGAAFFEIMGALLLTGLFAFLHKRSTTKESFDTTDSE